jgi:hypothetical protein
MEKAGVPDEEVRRALIKTPVRAKTPTPVRAKTPTPVRRVLIRTPAEKTPLRGSSGKKTNRVVVDEATIVRHKGGGGFVKLYAPGKLTEGPDEILEATLVKKKNTWQFFFESPPKVKSPSPKKYVTKSPSPKKGTPSKKAWISLRDLLDEALDMIAEYEFGGAYVTNFKKSVAELQHDVTMKVYTVLENEGVDPSSSEEWHVITQLFNAIDFEEAPYDDMENIVRQLRAAAGAFFRGAGRSA